MARKKHNYHGSSEAEERAFYSGVNSGQADSDVHAFFVGVGYGKGARGDRHVGFREPSQKSSFDRGVENCNKHFSVVEVDKPWWKRLFSGERSDDFSRGRARRQKKQDHRTHRARTMVRNKKRFNEWRMGVQNRRKHKRYKRNQRRKKR